MHNVGWWNYFELGLDFLVDGASEGNVSKIMVHSNIVRPVFGKYSPMLVLTASEARNRIVPATRKVSLDAPCDRGRARAYPPQHDPRLCRCVSCTTLSPNEHSQSDDRAADGTD